MATNASREGEFRHDAFICYSRADVGIARALERALERYRPPPELERPARLLDIFRDEQDFTGVEYTESIRRHLRSSAKLIVLCSPAARKSSFVNDEIRWFAEARGARNIVPVLHAGNPTCDANDEISAFPPALCEALAPLPIGPDYRNLNERRERVDLGSFQGAWFGLLANLLDVERSEIEQRELRRRRRRQRITAGILAAVIALLSSALVFALLSRNEAIRERDLAEQRRKQALARQLMTDSLSLADRQYDSAVLLALEAARISPAVTSQTHLQRLLNRNTEFRRIVRLHRAPVLALLVSDDGTSLASADEEGLVITGESAGQVQEQALPISGKAAAAAFTRDGTRLAFAVDNGIEVWNVVELRRLQVLKAHSRSVTSVDFSPDGTLLASGSWDTTAIVWNVDQGRPAYAPLAGHTESPDVLSLAKGVLGVAFSPRGTLLATTGGDNTAIVWDVATGRRKVGPLTGHGIRHNQLFPGVRTVAFSPDEQTLATGGDDSDIRLWELASGRALGEPLKGHTGALRALAFIDDGQGLVSADEFGDTRVWAVRDRRPLKVLRGHAGRVNGLTVFAGHAVLSSGEDGKIIEWDPFAWNDRLATTLVHPAPDAQPRALRSTSGHLGGRIGQVAARIGAPEL
jgi:hypothetical protein